MVSGMFLEGLVISMLVGALLGLEREYTKRQELIGLRTFSLISLFGFLTVIMSEMFYNTVVIFLGFVFVAIFSILLYISGMMRGERIGFTTCIAALITFVLGVFIGFGWRIEAVFLAVLVSIVLFSKERMHMLVSKLNQKEVGDLLEFLVLLGIIYPILPNSAVILGIDMPLLTIWGIMVLVSVINFFVFLGSRYLPVQHKVELFSFLGGLMDAKAMVVALMNIYKHSKKMFQNISSGFLLANMAMYVRNCILIGIIAPATLYYIGLPVALVLLTLLPFSRLFALIKHKEKKIRIESPFGVLQAVKLGCAIFVVFFILNISKVYSGDVLYITSAIGGFFSSLAVSVSLGTLVMNHAISAREAAFSFITANAAGAVSTLVVLYIMQGKNIIEKTYKALIISTIVSFLGVMLAFLLF